MLNSTAALCTAYGASTPVVCITGQVPSTFLGAGKGHLHELPDQLATMRTLTKWAARIEHPARGAGLGGGSVSPSHQRSAGSRGFGNALGRFWHASSSRRTFPPFPHFPIEPDPEDIARAASLLRRAKNPMIMVGGGAVHASAEVLRLAEALQAPVVSLRSGRGIVSDEHYLGFSCAAGFRRWRETDVLLGIGSRLELQWFRWPNQPPDLRVITLDVDPRHTARIRPTLGLVGDAKVLAGQLAAILEDGPVRPSRREEFACLKKRVGREIQRIRPYVQHLQAIRDALPRDGFLVEEICQAGFASYYAFPVFEPRKFVTGGYQGTLGFGYSTALGVQAANSGKAVVSITGDGGFQFGLQELATAVQYNLPVVVVVFNNGAYGNILRDQERIFGRSLGAELCNPDFVALAHSYGMSATRVSTAGWLRRRAGRALKQSAPSLIEVPVNDRAEPSPWEFLMPSPS